MKNEPIKTQKEAGQVFNFLVRETVRVTGCDETQAKLRIRALMDSGKLTGADPQNPQTQKMIDEFMFTPIFDA